MVGDELVGFGSDTFDSAAPEAESGETRPEAAIDAAEETDDSDDLVYLSPESEVEKSMSDLDAVGAVDTPPATLQPPMSASAISTLTPTPSPTPIWRSTGDRSIHLLSWQSCRARTKRPWSSPPPARRLRIPEAARSRHQWLG
jgi:hypothetical protein